MTSLLTPCVAFSLLTAPAVADQAIDTGLKWTPETLMQTKSISDVQISPDHASVLFVVTEPKLDKEKGSMFSRIYKTRADGLESPLPFSAADVSSTQPEWSPNGEWVAFLSLCEGVKNLYLAPASGGEAIALTKSQKDVQTFSWSPDGTKIAFVMTDETEATKRTPKTSLAYVYRQKTTVNRLWLVDVFAHNTQARPLTSDDYCVRGCGDFGTTNVEFDWSPDSKQLAFAYSPGVDFEHFYLDSHLATVDIATDHVTALEKLASYEALPRYSPDGQWIAYISDNSSQKYSINRQLAMRSSCGNRHRLLSQTSNEGPLLSGPHLLGWTSAGDHLLFFEPKGTKYHLVLVPVDGSPSKEIETGGLFFKAPALSRDKTMLGLVVQTPATPPEAYVTPLEPFKPIQISHVNDALLAYPQTHTHVVSWKSTDGMQIEGLLTYPIDYEEGKQYPLLLVIHGGPMGFFDETFIGTANPYPLASFAQEGFMILRPNPRGSCGYGKQFRCANYHDWGGADFTDILTGVDRLIDQGMADPEKLGIMGWSYGGYMSAWAVTQTTRFKAASIGAALCNLVSMNGTTDLHRLLTDYLGLVTKSRALYENRSPIHFVPNVTTPCLIQHGTNDTRVPVSQAYEFYHALHRLGKEGVLILYPGMGHRLTDPNMQLDAMKRNAMWFQEHLNKNL